MFDNTLNSSWDERSRRGMTTFTSFGLQALAVGVLLIVPLLRTRCWALRRALSPPASVDAKGVSNVPAAGSKCAHSGAGGVAGRDQQARRHRKPQNGGWPSYAGARGD